MRALISAACILGLCALVGGCTRNETTSIPETEAFGDPQPVTIIDYDGDAMEPFLSRDGRLLFFNNSNDPSVDTNLHWSERIDDLHFRYRGEIAGVNTRALEGVASMDRNGAFYFVSTRSYDQTASTLYRAQYAHGTASRVELVPGVSLKIPGIVNFDAEISADGDTLYFVDGRFAGGPLPKSANLVIASRSGNGFMRLPDSARLLAAVNSEALEYAPSISSDGLELFFTRFNGAEPMILMSTRPDARSAFAAPSRIAAIRGFAEAPSLSDDGHRLYYHRREKNGRFVIYRVTRQR